MFDSNVVFVTIDCCRFDAAQAAKLPFMRSVGALHCAQTYGTYTLPAHMSYFAGYLPKVVDGEPIDYYSRGAKQLWRLSTARQKPAGKVGLLMEGATIVEGYRRRGYYCLGAGGVRWFRSTLLTSHFDDFRFWGCDDATDVFAPRSPDDFALHHADELAQQLRPHKRWFLFLNAQETHAPYDVGFGHPSETWAALAKAQPLWGGKRCEPANAPDSRDFELLRAAQIRALEAVDERLAYLMDRLPGPKLVVICGDHGEAFGENGLYGHGFPAAEVVHVPLLVGTLAG